MITSSDSREAGRGRGGRREKGWRQGEGGTVDSPNEAKCREESAKRAPLRVALQYFSLEQIFLLCKLLGLKEICFSFPDNYYCCPLCREFRIINTEWEGLGSSRFLTKYIHIFSTTRTLCSNRTRERANID